MIFLALAAAVVVRSLATAVQVLRRDPGVDTTVREDREAFEFQELLVRKRSLIAAIRGAELDCDTGKIAEADRDRVIARLEREAAVVMRKLDELSGSDEDIAAAAAQIDAAMLQARDRVGETDENWSPIARARHGQTQVQTP